MGYTWLLQISLSLSILLPMHLKTEKVGNCISCLTSLSPTSSHMTRNSMPPRTTLSSFSSLKPSMILNASAPPFYLEGDSSLWCTLKSKYYALSSPFPL